MTDIYGEAVRGNHRRVVVANTAMTESGLLAILKKNSTTCKINFNLFAITLKPNKKCFFFFSHCRN